MLPNTVNFDVIIIGAGIVGFPFSKVAHNSTLPKFRFYLLGHIIKNTAATRTITQLMSTTDTYENHLHATTPRWFAVYTNYKREKIVRKMLAAKEIEAYLPIQKITRRYVRKVKHLELPLINCYIFVKITKSEYIRVLETEHVIKFIQFSNNLLSIPEREIQLMKRIIGEELNFTIEPAAFVEGEEVEVIGGELTGLEGKLISIAGNQRFLVELTNIGFHFQMEIDPSLLRRKKGHSQKMEKV